MMNTYPEFLAVCDAKCSLYGQIPDRYLTVEGQKVYELYKNVMFDGCFASNATELLSLLIEDEDVAAAAKYAGSEYRKIIRCLERLVSKEDLAPTT